MTHFLLLKLILTLNADAVDRTAAGQERFIMSLSDAEAEELTDQIEDISVIWCSLRVRRKWREENRQPGFDTVLKQS